MSSVVFHPLMVRSYGQTLKVSQQALAITNVRAITSREWRDKNNRFKNRLDDMPDWSYTDGRGYGPPSVAQKARYLSHQQLGQTVVRRMKEMQEAKKFK